ncbi:hypothetical protein [Entomomonas asaccharolytica]|uniref:Uncharacterized protein n=1 Tax=Entomomonas asaccharolytica TaxID=2785331 RepID=A0A974RYN2_9GAMM|nr:hypothetical protein [Entomomonas asaccharolytica]QQP86074.1 hypothetical protein JHT90_02120 [Entomomonas asaccharolytica]
MTYKSISFRCHAIDRYMQQNYPKLYDWWRKCQEREDLAFTKDIEHQATIFLNWLDERINKKDYSCPNAISLC